MLSFQLTLLIVIIIFLILFLSLIKSYLEYSKSKDLSLLRFLLNKNNNKDIILDYDKRKIYDELEAPAKRPERTQMGYLPVMKKTNNPLEPYATRGYPDNYHLLGTLQKVNNDENTSYNPLTDENKLIKLYGRQKYPGSREYEYYTSLSTGNDMTKIPIKNDNRELYNNDIINIPILNSDYQVNMYPNEELKYNPFVF